MSKACSVCSSKHRAEIEERLKKEESFRSISAWLLQEKGEVVPKTTLHTHAKNHQALASAFVKQLFSAPRLQVISGGKKEKEDALPSDTSLPPLEALAFVQNKAVKVLDALAEKMEEDGLTPQQVTLWNGCMKEARQAAKNRHELVHGKWYHLTGNLNPTRRDDLKDLSTQELEKLEQELLGKEEEPHVH